VVAVLWAAPAGAQVTVGTDVAVNSRYMFWGLTLSNRPVVQPDVWLSVAGLRQRQPRWASSPTDNTVPSGNSLVGEFASGGAASLLRAGGWRGDSSNALMVTVTVLALRECRPRRLEQDPERRIQHAWFGALPCLYRSQ